MQPAKKSDFWNPKAAGHILVTGGAGYVGQHLIRQLLAAGRNVTAVDANYFSAEPLRDLCSHPLLRVIKADIRYFEPCWLDEVDAIVHLAAISNDPASEIDPAWTQAVNLDATIRLAELARTRNVRKFVFASSCSLYGASNGDLLTEEAALAPVSLYAKSKMKAEEALLQMSRDHFRPVCLRGATAFGVSSRMRFDLVVNAMTLHSIEQRKILITGGGQQWRPLIHVADLARAYVKVIDMDGDKIEGGVYNVVGQNCQIDRLADTVKQHAGEVDIEAAPGDQDSRSYRVSGQKFNQWVNWEPMVTVDEGVAEIADRLQQGYFGDTNQLKYYTVMQLKALLNKPAIEGGVPVRSEFLAFVRPSIGTGEEDEVIDSLRSGWLTTGPKVQRLEKMFEEYLGCKHAIAVNSCTSALHLSLAALGIGPGDEVITSPVTWPSTTNVIIHLGAVPVFVDVERDTLNMDPNLIEGAITPKTKAILPVHMAGQPCDLDAIHEIASRYGLAVVEDAAHAIGARYRERKIGNINPLTCFSFYPTKNITTIEGGLITTEDDELAGKIRMLSMFGISRDAWKRYSSEGSAHWELIVPGYKYNMPDIMAAVGLHQVPRLEEFIAKREAYVQRFRKSLDGIPGITMLTERPWARHVHHLFIILIHPEVLNADRDHFMAALKAENIGTGIHFRSLHMQPYFRNLGLKRGDFPNAAWLSDRILSLPLYPKMSSADVDDVVTAVKKLAAAYLHQTNPADSMRRQSSESLPTDEKSEFSH